MDDKSPGGWGVFAGLMLIMTGTFNAVEGIASLTAPTRLFVGEEKMLILDYDRWGGCSSPGASSSSSVVARCWPGPPGPGSSVSPSRC
ncbi:hypothetical protein BTZ20_5488 [Rhodococcus sp. MTM3W5.2]|nr:hypothetical protein BTZ20_5488 [Rhodococcus sp. MTM3W5.2]